MKPYWVEAFETKHGTTPRLQSGRAYPRRCKCKAWVLEGLDDRVCAQLARVDPNVLTRQQEAACLILGISTWRLWGVNSARLELQRRLVPSLPATARWSPPIDETVIALAAHRCGMAPLGGDPIRLFTRRGSDWYDPNTKPPF